MVKRLWGRPPEPAPPADPYDELRTSFTAAVSHELRTPLARLLALLDGAELPDADLRAIVARARDEVDEMRVLVDDILFLSELETGQQIVQMGNTPVVPVLEAAAAAAAVHFDHSGVTVRISGENTVSVPVRERMLRVVADNLIANTVRYAGSGATLLLDVRAAPGSVVLTASDDGAGVDDEDLPRLFERFYRADRVRTSRGTGLGLALVKHVVTSAGGSVEAARGEGGRGLVIRCTFPLR